MAVQARAFPAGYSYPSTAVWFIAGGVVTAVFSGSLAVLTDKANVAEVLMVGMCVPSFTWIVQMSASAIGLTSSLRRLYWGDLGRVCLLGSVALLPAGILNLSPPQAPLWLSAANVLVSVALMGLDLFRRSARHGIAVVWPISWCLTISVNMGLFVWSSWAWW
jgi:hypothetical protein